MNDDGLEQRIRTAMRADAPAEQVARLESFWRARSRVERRRRLAGRAIAAAAAVAAIVGAAIWLTRSEPNVAPPIAIRQQPSAPANESPPLIARSPDEPPAAATPPKPLSAGRPATDYERLMLAISTRNQFTSRHNELQAAVDAAIEELAGDPNLDEASLVNVDDLSKASAERLLLNRLPRANEAQQLAIVRLLAQYGTPRAATALVAMDARDALRPAIVDAVERIVGVDQFQGIVRQSRSRELRADLLARMFNAGSDAALRGFLSLVHHEKLRPEVLAVADSAAEPPIGSLMKLLEDDDKRTRLSAAIALGHMNGPAVTSALIELVTDRPSASAEAWIALLSCRDESADQFLAAASHVPRWLGHVNNARITLARMVQ